MFPLWQVLSYSILYPWNFRLIWYFQQQKRSMTNVARLNFQVGLSGARNASCMYCSWRKTTWGRSSFYEGECRIILQAVQAHIESWYQPCNLGPFTTWLVLSSQWRTEEYQPQCPKFSWNYFLRCMIHWNGKKAPAAQSEMVLKTLCPVAMGRRYSCTIMQWGIRVPSCSNG